MIDIRYADYNDVSDLVILDFLDKNLSEKGVHKTLLNKQYLLLCYNNSIIGLLRFGFFNHDTPIIELIYLTEEYLTLDNIDYLYSYWEKDMKYKNYNLVLAISQSDIINNYLLKQNYLACGNINIDENNKLFYKKSIK